MAGMSEKDVLRFAVTAPGEPCVMTSGTAEMPVLYVLNSDTLEQVKQGAHHHIL